MQSKKMDENIMNTKTRNFYKRYKFSKQDKNNTINSYNYNNISNVNTNINRYRLEYSIC